METDRAVKSERLSHAQIFIVLLKLRYVSQRKRFSAKRLSMATQKKADKNKPAAKNGLSELNAPRWSVVSFEKCVAKNLSYAEAAEELGRLRKQKVSGLCIITDEAAARISKQD